jgi:hypothetical protein
LSGRRTRLSSGGEAFVGALFRREGLYSSYLTAWRRERDDGELAGPTPKKRGRKPQGNPLADENARLQGENTRLQHELYKANTIIDVQTTTLGLELLDPSETKPGESDEAMMALVVDSSSIDGAKATNHVPCARRGPGDVLPMALARLVLGRAASSPARSSVVRGDERG